MICDTRMAGREKGKFCEMTVGRLRCMVGRRGTDRDGRRSLRKRGGDSCSDSKTKCSFRFYGFEFKYLHFLKKLN